MAACALAPLGLRIISPLTFYLSFLGAIWTYDKNLAPIFPSHLCRLVVEDRNRYVGCRNRDVIMVVQKSITLQTPPERRIYTQNAK